jgi:hypothetical protein
MHSRKVVQKHLSKLKDLKYNQFRWWRTYQLPSILPKSSHLEKRIDNGDFEPSPYFWMAQEALWEKHDSDNSGLEDWERAKRGGLLMTKYERLMHDFEVDEEERFTNFVNALYDCFEVDKDFLEEDVKKFDGTIKDYYIHIRQNYNVRRVAPKRRGRPKKI